MRRCEEERSGEDSVYTAEGSRKGGEEWFCRKKEE